MRRLLVLFALCCAALPALPALGSGEPGDQVRAAARRCVPAGASVVVRSRKAVVVRRDRLVDSGERVPHHYGCLFSRGRLVLLDDNDGGLGAHLVRPVRFAGRYVAHVQDFQDMGLAPDSTSVVVTDLRRGRSLVSDCTAEEDDGEDVECYENRVISLVLRSTGGVAWIDENGNVVKHDGRATGPGTLDFGRRIDRHSLRLRGSRLSWVKNGRRRTATLR